MNPRAPLDSLLGGSLEPGEFVGELVYLSRKLAQTLTERLDHRLRGLNAPGQVMPLRREPARSGATLDAVANAHRHLLVAGLTLAPGRTGLVARIWSKSSVKTGPDSTTSGRAGKLTLRLLVVAWFSLLLTTARGRTRAVAVLCRERQSPLSRG